ncbi:MAG: hypothetical protein J7454_15865, partial [Roseiflexus sp.]|nr:hypothetical protein [Roseiflexus sp.]
MAQQQAHDASSAALRHQNMVLLRSFATTYCFRLNYKEKWSASSINLKRLLSAGEMAVRRESEMAQAKATPSPVLQEQIRHFRRLTNAEQQFVRQLIEALIR